MHTGTPCVQQELKSFFSEHKQKHQIDVMLNCVEIHYHHISIICRLNLSYTDKLCCWRLLFLPTVYETKQIEFKTQCFAWNWLIFDSYGNIEHSWININSIPTNKFIWSFIIIIIFPWINGFWWFFSHEMGLGSAPFNFSNFKGCKNPSEI